MWNLRRKERIIEATDRARYGYGYGDGTERGGCKEQREWYGEEGDERVKGADREGQWIWAVHLWRSDGLHPLSL